MNYRFVINQLGLLLIVLSAVGGLVAGWNLLHFLIGGNPEQAAAGALLVMVGSGLIVGGGMCYLGRSHRSATFLRREAMLLVALSWLVAAALGALPFFCWAHFAQPPDTHPFYNYIDCYFETMSGMTTTGATVLGGPGAAIEDLPRGIMLWRCLTHWLGGLGIVVLFVAVLPTVGVGGKKIFHVEAPGPTHAGVRPKIRETARILWLIYLGLTVAQTLALRLCGMNWFDALCHTFSTLATGGFSNRGASMGAYSDAAIWITIFFMILAGMNFGLYYQMIRGHWRSVWRAPETRLYFALMAVGGVIICAALYVSPEPIHTTVPADEGGLVTARSDGYDSAKHGLFQAVSIITTTGFCTADFNRWPFLAVAVLIFFMFVGGCAGSTAGGIKVVRIWIGVKILAAEIERVFRPQVVRSVRLGESGAIDPELRQSVLAFILGIIVLVAAGSFVIMLLESGSDRCDFTTAFTSALATVCTIGPGLNAIGAVESYGWMTSASKAVLALLMAFGRLEVFAILVLFYPRFWTGR